MSSSTSSLSEKPSQFGLGYLPDLPDHRDRYYQAPPSIIEKLPSSVDLRPQCTFALYDQGSLGSCTANSIGSAIQYCLKKQAKTEFIPSRLFIYYNERRMEGTIGSDAGAMIRDGIKSVNRDGATNEDIWPYIIEKFTQKPPGKAYKDARYHQAIQYSRIAQDLDQMKSCLAEGYPFVYGFAVYSSFFKAQAGQIPLPAKDEQLLGGHAVLAVGYDDATSRFITRNSWGNGWGDKGYFYMPYDYLTNTDLVGDLWSIRLLE